MYYRQPILTYFHFSSVAIDAFNIARVSVFKAETDTH